MDSHKLVLKLFAENPSAVPHAAFVPVFHSLIQAHALPDHLLIDVSDYQHVHNGPGTLLVAHEANIYLDNGEGRPGLLYQRKQPFAGAQTPRDRLAQTFIATLRVAARLEADPALEGKLRFATNEIVFRVNDRLLAPNTPQTFAALEPTLRAFMGELTEGARVTLDPRHDPLTPFEVRIKTDRPASANDLLARAESMAAAPALSR
jgi:hypothetical protein